MSEHMKKRRINTNKLILCVSQNQNAYAIPKEIAEKYIVADEKLKKTINDSIPAKALLEPLYKKFTKSGVLLKGLRIRENSSQVEFAKKIHVTQANLSKMENGKRPIGKIIAKRIEKIFGTDYRHFLE
jgi:DNA-binding XRE family transcriptional regulator